MSAEAEIRRRNIGEGDSLGESSLKPDDKGQKPAQESTTAESSDHVSWPTTQKGKKPSRIFPFLAKNGINLSIFLASIILALLSPAKLLPSGNDIPRVTHTHTLFGFMERLPGERPSSPHCLIPLPNVFSFITGEICSQQLCKMISLSLWFGFAQGHPCPYITKDFFFLKSSNL